MAYGVTVSGFGQVEYPYVERPPLPRAEFRLPPDVHMMRAEMGRDFLEITLRLPLPNDGNWPDWCPHESFCPAPENHRAKALSEAESAQYLDDGDDDD